MHSGNRCAFWSSGCKTALIAGKTNYTAILGHVAHICGKKKGSAKYSATMSDAERNHYANLIYLCPTCHTKIDKLSDIYSVEKLQKIKTEHEELMFDAVLASKVLNFAELEVTVKAIDDTITKKAFDSSIMRIISQNPESLKQMILKFNEQ